MIKIGIELNNIVRDLNTQILKYYQKDIDKTFEETSVNKNKVSIIDELKFGNKKGKFNFMYVDYPYELFGCANAMHKQLPVMINNFLVKLTNIGESDENVSFFSLKETALTIQSTYFFLSKIGVRVRNMIFPINGATLWDKFDVLITTNENIVLNKPSDKKVVLIKKDDNKKLIGKSDLVYDSLYDLLLDEKFLEKININKKKTSFKEIILNKIKTFFK